MIGERIKQVRGDETQAAFGARFNKSRSTILRYETGERVPDADFIIDICRAYNINANWLLTGEEPMRIEPSNRETHIDMVNDVLLGDKEAAARGRERTKQAGALMRASREEVEKARRHVGIDDLPEPSTETEKKLRRAVDYLSEMYHTAEFGRLNAERQADRHVVAGGAQGGDMPSDALGMAEGMTMLGRIYGSGDNVFIRAINANLSAFNEALDNKAFAQRSAEQINKLEKTMEEMENRLTKLEKENTELQHRLQRRETRDGTAG